MRTISDIYEEYRLMKTLRLHMLRVAAVASMICDSFDEPIDKEKIVKVCLLHDMGNIIKFDLTRFPEFSKPQGIEYWQSIQKEFIEKYGNHEHDATVAIIKELGMNEEIVELADQIHFHLLCEHANSESILIKIIHYADLRVGPFGVLPLENRLQDAHKRYNAKERFGEDSINTLDDCARRMENQIFEHCSIKPEDINDESIKETMEGLKDFVI